MYHLIDQFLQILTCLVMQIYHLDNWRFDYRILNFDCWILNWIMEAVPFIDQHQLSIINFWVDC